MGKKTVEEKLEAVARLERLLEKKRKLLEELRYSLEIEQLIPDAFEHGSCQLRWTRTMKKGFNNYEYEGIVTRGDSSTRAIPKDALLPQVGERNNVHFNSVHRKAGR